MLVSRHDRRDLRFTVAGLLVFTGISAVLVAVWLPNFRVQFETAKSHRITEATKHFLGHVEREEITELAEQLSIGANPNATARIMWGDRMVSASALNIALRKGNDGIVQMLLNAGADPNLSVPQAPLLTALERRANVLDKQKLGAILLKSGANLRTNLTISDTMLAEKLPDAVAILKQHGIEYGLREMCIAGDIELLKKHLAALLQVNSTPIRAYRGSSTLLGIAIQNQHTEMAVWLLKSDASTDVNDVHQANAIHLAAAHNCVDLLPPLVLASCNVNAGDCTGDTPLNYAIPNSEPATIAALIDLGADVLKFNAELGVYPIHQAAERYYRAHSQNSGAADADRIVIELLAAGADEKQLDASGRTAVERTRELRGSFERLCDSNATTN